MSMNQVASDLYQAISEAEDRKVKPYDTKAEVLRTEGNTVWVKIPGGVDETPAQKTVNAKVGDIVQVSNDAPENLRPDGRQSDGGSGNIYMGKQNHPAQGEAAPTSRESMLADGTITDFVAQYAEVGE